MHFAGIHSAWRSRDFRRWFLAQIFSASGAMTQVLGQSWLILQLTHSGVALSMLTVAVFGPVLLGGAAAGTMLDRMDVRRLLLVTQLSFVAIGTVLVALVATGSTQLWLIYASAVATGVVNAFDGPARQVYIVELVAREHTGAAVGLYEVVLNAARVLGPAVAGVLLATWGVLPCFVFNAAAFVPAVVVLLIRRSSGGGPAPAPRGRTGGIRAGLRYVRQHRDVRACVLLAAVSGALFNASVTLPLLAVETFGLGGGGYGAMSAAFGVGALLGAFAAAVQSGPPTGRRIRVLALLVAAAVLATACAPGVVTVMLGLAVAGFLGIWLIAAANTMALLRPDPAFRGRVMGVWNMALPGMVPFTAMASGATIDAFGPRPGFGLAGVGFLMAVAIGWTALRDRPDPERDGAAER